MREPIDFAAEEGDPAEDGTELAHDLEDERLGKGCTHGLDPELAGERNAEPALKKDNRVGVEQKIENQLNRDNFNDKDRKKMAD